MNVVVLLAGVHDPRWPIAVGADADRLPCGEHQVMSPFDEAALEIALRLRDADAAVRISAFVAGGAAGQRIARAVAALNVPEVSVVSLPRGWDQLATARGLARVCEGADLALIGREFGDCDDGLVPPLLAQLLGVAFFGRAQVIETGSDSSGDSDRAIRLTRERETCIETLRLTGPAVVSVTNDRRTRLRKPLMKNVMLARQAVIGALELAPGPAAALAVERVAPGAFERNGTACTMIAGTIDEQARELAQMLWEARA